MTLNVINLYRLQLKVPTVSEENLKLLFQYKDTNQQFFFIRLNKEYGTHFPNRRQINHQILLFTILLPLFAQFTVNSSYLDHFEKKI